MEELLASSKTIFSSISRGQEVTGKIMAITDSEVLIDLGGKSDGLIPTRVLDPKELETLKVGQEIKAFVIEPENESGQVVLATQKAPAPKVNRPGQFSSNQIDPVLWAQALEKYLPNETFKGTVTKITQFGAFVKLEEGIEGLIHSSKMGDQTLEVGQPISVSVDSVDDEKKRISLSPVITSTKGLIYK